jgi:Xaa-Pro aminopeptidase
MQKVAGLLRKEGCCRIAVDRLRLPSFTALQWEMGHPRKAIVIEGGAPIVMSARVTKTADEIECIQRAQLILEMSQEMVKALLRPGADYKELNDAMRGFFLDLDPDGDALSTALGPAASEVLATWHVASACSYNPAGEPSLPFPPRPGRPFAAGDVVWPDSNLRYLGLESDHGRTWIVDQPPPGRLLDQYKRWRDVRDQVVDVLRPGKTAADVIAAGTAGLTMQPWLSHLYLVHGVGLHPAEYPLIGVDPDGWAYQMLLASGSPPWRSEDPQAKSLPRNEELELASGMVLVVEPVIWDTSDEAGGYRAEDVYVVTESAPKLISHAPYADFE